MDNGNDKIIEELKNEIVDLKIRLKRIEEMLQNFPNADDYIEDLELNINDPLYDDAVNLVSHFETVSASFLQRKLIIGYSRAARLLDQLEEGGIVGPAEGAKPRIVLKKE